MNLNLESCPIIRHAGVNTHGRPRRRRERYRDLGTWSLHLYRYHANLCIDGEWHELHPGHATLLPPDAQLEYRYRGLSTHTCVHFSIAESARAPQPANVVSIPAVQALGQAFAPFNMQLEKIIAKHAVAPIRAAVGLWDLLWQVAELAEAHARRSAGAASSSTTPAVVTEVMELIEMRLGKRLYVGDLASELGISHAYLTRLFREATGYTLIAHIARRRSERAVDLLVHTRMPVKSIAAQVGLPDLHQFNKLIRRLWGKSPREIRRQRTS